MKMTFRKGFTLIEVLVATMILAFVAVTCATLLISTYSAFPTEKSRYQAALAAASLKEELRNYVTDDTAITLNAPGNPPWHLVDDSSCTDCWALSAMRHYVTGRLPPELVNKFGATMYYDVELAEDGGRTVKVTIDWGSP